MKIFIFSLFTDFKISFRASLRFWNFDNLLLRKVKQNSLSDNFDSLESLQRLVKENYLYSKYQFFYTINCLQWAGGVSFVWNSNLKNFFFFLLLKKKKRIND